MKTKLLNIEDVSLKTLQVQIKALTIEGRQMTLSVFRQLPEYNILDENLNFRGVPWGLVNYFWKDNEAALHVVWQLGEKLYRSLIKRKPWRVYIEGVKDSYFIKVNGDSITYHQNYGSSYNIEDFKCRTGATNQQIEEAIDNYKNYCGKFDTLSQLPQLFIAL